MIPTTTTVNISLSDPFARISFLDKSMVTEKLDKTLCPTWDQSLIFENILIHGEAQAIAMKPPQIVVEIFDHDTFVSQSSLWYNIHLKVCSNHYTLGTGFSNPADVLPCVYLMHCRW